MITPMRWRLDIRWLNAACRIQTVSAGRTSPTSSHAIGSASGPSWRQNHAFVLFGRAITQIARSNSAIAWLRRRVAHGPRRGHGLGRAHAPGGRMPRGRTGCGGRSRREDAGRGSPPVAARQAREKKNGCCPHTERAHGPPLIATNRFCRNAHSRADREGVSPNKGHARRMDGPTSFRGAVECKRPDHSGE